MQDGLLALSHLIADENLYLRSQAVEVFMRCTSEDTCSWFKTPEGPNDPVLRFHERLFKLSGTPFIKDLTANYDESYPGGSFTCLELLAFWLSWVRIFYAKDQKLRLSKHLLNVLKSWSHEQSRSKEERAFAKKLYDDFSRLPPADDDLDLGNTSGHGASSGDSTDPIENAATPPQPPTTSTKSGGEEKVNAKEHDAEAADAAADQLKGATISNESNQPHRNPLWSSSYDPAADEEDIYRAFMRRFKGERRPCTKVLVSSKQRAESNGASGVDVSENAGTIPTPLWTYEENKKVKAAKKKKRKKVKAEKKNRNKTGVAKLLREAKKRSPLDFASYIDENVAFEDSGAQYQNTFKDSLSPDLLAAVINASDAASKAEKEDLALRIMLGTSKVNRFATNLLFLSEATREKLSWILSRLSSSSNVDRNRFNALESACDV